MSADGRRFRRVYSEIQKNTFFFKVNAMLISLEHRYYGKSIPVSDLTTENMKYCNHNQALADLANFVDVQGKAMNLTEEKWITFGGSYPGMMAGWARLKFPTAIYASVASSAPVQAQVNSFF